MSLLHNVVNQFDLAKPTQELGCALDASLGFIPGRIVVENLAGKYIWGNHQLAEDLGLQCRTDIIHKSVFDIVDEQSATIVFNHDKEVIEQGAEKTFIEQGRLINGVQTKCIVSKKPIKNQRDEVAGLLIISHDILKVSIDENNDVEKIINQGLSTREAQIVYRYSQGKSAKEIASLLNISYRTVEKHIENARLKLGLYRRSQLFEFVQNILRTLMPH